MEYPSESGLLRTQGSVLTKCTPSTRLVAPVDFNDRLIDRVRASVEFAFRSAERPLKTASPNATALYCPLPLGNPILDAMVKLIADQVHADVVELDALELVTGSVLRTSDETGDISSVTFLLILHNLYLFNWKQMPSHKLSLRLTRKTQARSKGLPNSSQR